MTKRRVSKIQELSDYVPVNGKIAQEKETKDSIVKSVDYPFDFFSDDKKCLRECKS